MIKFNKKGGGYFNKEHDLYIEKNQASGDWDMWAGNEWAADAKTKRELVAFAQRGWGE